MTRGELLAMIYEDNTVRSCPTEEIKCELEDSEINTQEYCKKCAEMLLTEYENNIRADERARVLDEIETKLYECGFIWTEHAEKVWGDIREQLKSDK